MSAMGQARGWGVVGVVATMLLGACSTGSGSSTAMHTHPPIDTSRSAVLPDPPFVLDTLAPAGISSHLLSGSPDRVVVVSDYGDFQYVPGSPTLPGPARRLAAFDFRRWRWKTLPKPRYDPVALPDGLAAVGLKCGPDQDSNRKCRVEVSTLRWSDKHWRNQVVTKHPEWVHEGGGVDLVGVRGRYAYFQAHREMHRIFLRVSASGDVRKLPVVPLRAQLEGVPETALPSATCVTARGVDTVWLRYGKSSFAPGEDPSESIEAGPVKHLDVLSLKPRWRTAPATEPIAGPERGSFACGRQGVLLLHSSGTSVWTGKKFATLTAASSPTPPDGLTVYFTAKSLADGGLVISDGLYLHRLHDGVWDDPPLPGERLPWTTVGNLIVYEATNPTTHRVELHAIP
jgi:hypothetical protein